MTVAPTARHPASPRLLRRPDATAADRRPAGSSRARRCPGLSPSAGEVWDVDLHDSGTHPAVVLSVNALNSRLGHVAVIPVTGTSGPAATHVPLTSRDAGLARYPESYADVTALQPVDRARLLRQRGRPVPSETDRLAAQLCTYLGL